MIIRNHSLNYILWCHFLCLIYFWNLHLSSFTKLISKVVSPLHSDHRHRTQVSLLRPYSHLPQFLVAHLFRSLIYLYFLKDNFYQLGFRYSDQASCRKIHKGNTRESTNTQSLAVHKLCSSSKRYLGTLFSGSLLQFSMSQRSTFLCQS